MFEDFFGNLSRKSKFDKELASIADTLHVDLCAFVITSGLILLRMRNVLGKSFSENHNHNVMFSNFIPKICRL